MGPCVLCHPGFWLISLSVLSGRTFPGCEHCTGPHCENNLLERTSGWLEIVIKGKANKVCKTSPFWDFWYQHINNTVLRPPWSHNSSSIMFMPRISNLDCSPEYQKDKCIFFLSYITSVMAIYLKCGA